MQSNPENNENASKNDSLPPLFSQEEIRSIVREFITAFIRGDITINFKSAEEIMMEAKFSKQKINLESAKKEELDAKAPFFRQMDICAGNVSVSDEERQKATNSLFQVILRARSSQRLQGKFMTFDAEKRFAQLEKDLKTTNELVAQILLSLKSGVVHS